MKGNLLGTSSAFWICRVLTDLLYLAFISVYIISSSPYVSDNYHSRPKYSTNYEDLSRFFFFPFLGKITNFVTMVCSYQLRMLLVPFV